MNGPHILQFPHLINCCYNTLYALQGGAFELVWKRPLRLDDSSTFPKRFTGSTSVYPTQSVHVVDHRNLPPALPEPDIEARVYSLESDEYANAACKPTHSFVAYSNDVFALTPAKRGF